MSSLRAVAITVSDRCARGEQADVSGPVLVDELAAAGAVVVETLILSDELEPLSGKLKELALRTDINLIVTTGGTGISPRDNTPEATLAVIEREVPGMSEAMRAASLARNANAMLSRGVCGVGNGTLIINFPGSPAGVKECFAVVRPVLSHAVELISGNTTH